MVIKNIQILLVMTILIQSHISQCAHVIDMGKVKHKRGGNTHLKGGISNRGRITKPKYDNSFNLEHALVIVPGQNGAIGFSAERFLPWLQKKHATHHWIGTPEGTSADFGQKNCMEKIISKKDIFKSDTGYVLFGTSQGTATSTNIFNATIQHPKALLLHSVMLSGNSAIYHTVTNMVLPFIAHLPLSYYWLPYLAKIGYQSYSPAGEQPIFNVGKIPTDLPIIILHCKNDRQLSFKDAQALYAALCKNGNKNVYLFEMPNSDGMVNHFVKFDNKTKKDILTILKNHKIITEKVDVWDSLEDDIMLRQPEVKQEWLDHFDTLLKKEKKMPYFDNFFKIATVSFKIAIVGLAAYLVYTNDIVNKALDRINIILN